MIYFDFAKRHKGECYVDSMVTGANRGLGLEFARQYAADGWEVIGTTRQAEKSEELRKLAGSHGNLRVQALDIASNESVQDLVDELNGKPIDVLILNSGVYPRGGQNIGQIDYEGWREAFETNVLGTIRVTEALLENVAASERKQIAAISTGMASLRAVQGGSVAAGRNLLSISEYEDGAEHGDVDPGEGSGTAGNQRDDV